MNKLEKLQQLGKLRQKAKRENYEQIPGEYDFGFVSPITKSAQNYDSSIMIILQDWSSTDNLKTNQEERAELGYTPTLPTNRNLDNLLDKIFNKSRSEFYITNLFPLVKRGDMKKKISPQDYIWALENFCLEEVKIIEPKFIICLGENVFKTFHKKFVGNKRKYVVGDNFHNDGITYFYQTHPASLAFNNRNKLSINKDQVLKDWATMHQAMN